MPSRRRRVKYRPAVPPTPAFGSLRFAFDPTRRLALIRHLQNLKFQKCLRGIPIEEFVIGVASTFQVGGGNRSDLPVLRGRTVTRQRCYDLVVAAPPTAGEWLPTFGQAPRR